MLSRCDEWTIFIHYPSTIVTKTSSLYIYIYIYPWQHCVISINSIIPWDQINTSDNKIIIIAYISSVIHTSKYFACICASILLVQAIFIFLVIIIYLTLELLFGSFWPSHFHCFKLLLLHHHTNSNKFYYYYTLIQLKLIKWKIIIKKQLLYRTWCKKNNT